MQQTSKVVVREPFGNGASRPRHLLSGKADRICLSCGAVEERVFQLEIAEHAKRYKGNTIRRLAGARLHHRPLLGRA